jgi:hypothetical protein
VTFGLVGGSMPRTIAPRIVVAARDQRLRGDEGRGTQHQRVAPAPARGGGAPVGQRVAPPGSNTSMCAITDSMRSRTSFWKPFITLSTMISAATPSAMPSIDTPEMKEMKPLRRPLRPLRV